MALRCIDSIAHLNLLGSWSGSTLSTPTSTSSPRTTRRSSPRPVPDRGRPGGGGRHCPPKGSGEALEEGAAGRLVLAGQAEQFADRLCFVEAGAVGVVAQAEEPEVDGGGFVGVDADGEGDGLVGCGGGSAGAARAAGRGCCGGGVPRSSAVSMRARAVRWRAAAVSAGAVGCTGWSTRVSRPGYGTPGTRGCRTRGGLSRSPVRHV